VALIATSVVVGVCLYTRKSVKANNAQDNEEKASLLRNDPIDRKYQGLKLPEIEIDLNDIEILERIGRGSAGDVYKVGIFQENSNEISGNLAWNRSCR
jgi:hypothetical protein